VDDVRGDPRENQLTMRPILAAATVIALAGPARAQSSAPPTRFTPEGQARIRQYAAAAGINCDDFGECVRRLTANSEARGPDGAPFDQMTPHDHLLAAQRALAEHHCTPDGHCVGDLNAALDAVLPHITAILGAGGVYVLLHAREVRALHGATLAINAVRHRAR
jgi:hypothetical protein